MENRITDLKVFQAELATLRISRDATAQRISTRMEMLGDAEVRSELIGSAVSGLIGAWAPVRRLRQAPHGGMEAWLTTAFSVLESFLGPGSGRNLLVKGVMHLLTNGVARARKRRRIDIIMAVAGAALMLFRSLTSKAKEEDQEVDEAA